MIIIHTGTGRKTDRQEPGKDFERQIEEHKGMHGTRCDFVECPYECLDFNTLSDQQLQYYLWFRDRFYEGEVIETDIGYSWLLLVELINTKEDPEAVMRHLQKLYRECNKQGYQRAFPAPAVTSNAMFSYAIANDLDVPRIYATSGVWRQILISELLLPEPEPIPDDAMDIVTGYPFENYWCEYAKCEHSYPLFNAALPAVDAKMRELTGKGILETFGEERTDVLKLFADGGWGAPAYFRDERCAVTYMSAGKALETFLGAMARYCQKAIEKDMGVGNGPSVASVFGKEYRKIVDRTLNRGDIIQPQRRPKTVRGTIRNHDVKDVMTPVYMSNEGFSHDCTLKNFLSDMARYSKQQPSDEWEYVPSGCRKPDYHHLSPEALEYYLWWRECARNGQYGTADEGYLWLYKCELINAYDDMRYVLDQLAGLARAYDKYIPNEWFGETKKPGRTYLDYAFINGLQIPDPTVFPCILSASDMVEMLLDGEEDTPVSANTMLVAAQFVGDKKSDAPVRAAFDEDCAHIAARVLMRINDSRSGDVVRKYCRLRTKKIKMNVFVHEKYYKWPTGRPKAQEREMLNIVENDIFLPEMKTLVKAVIAAVRDRDKPRKGKGTYAFGVPLDDMLQNEVKKWFCEKNARAAEKRLLSFSIDQSEVDRAQADLDRVTSIMSTEEQAAEEAPETEKDAPKADPGDPWQAFADRLNKGQKEYLRKALAGTIRAVKPSVEDSINAAAMDTVKDTVVEGGKAFEEYADDVKKALGLGDERDR